jgi:hypothetical protein
MQLFHILVTLCICNIIYGADLPSVVVGNIIYCISTLKFLSHDRN